MVNVFISWSGEVSKEIAEELRKWIPAVLQVAKPYFTPNDIEKGTKWSGEISKRLADTHVGIVCLTPDNRDRPWILFEAGALSKDLDRSKVCSVLFGMETTDLTGPLTTFQTTTFDKTDFKKLMKTINAEAGEVALENETFDRTFEMWWPQLRANVETILGKEREKDHGNLRSDRELLEEILALQRVSSKRADLPTRRPDIPISALADLLNAVESLVRESRHYKDDDILDGAQKVFTVSRFLAETTISRHPGLLEHIENVGKELDECRQRNAQDRSYSGTKGSIDDDEIPF